MQLRRGATARCRLRRVLLHPAADADPDDADYLFNLGYAYVARPELQGGASTGCARRCGGILTDADAHYVLAVALQATGSAVEAAREQDLARQLSSRYERIDQRAGCRQTPMSRADWNGFATDPSGRERPAAGSAIVNSAQREHRDLAAFHLDRGRRLFEREQDREAMAELRRAVYLSPYEAPAHLLIGRIYLRAGRPEDAIDALKISIWSEDTAAARDSRLRRPTCR